MRPDVRASGSPLTQALDSGKNHSSRDFAIANPLWPPIPLSCTHAPLVLWPVRRSLSLHWIERAISDCLSLVLHLILRRPSTPSSRTPPATHSQNAEPARVADVTSIPSRRDVLRISMKGPSSSTSRPRLRTKTTPSSSRERSDWRRLSLPFLTISSSLGHCMEQSFRRRLTTSFRHQLSP